jgi:hypothetical protein
MTYRPSILLACLGLLIATPPEAGAQWKLAGDTGGGCITSFAVKGTILFAATRESGVFLSIDDGAHWRPADTGLPAKSVCQCLAVIDDNVFVGTLGHGVFLSANNGGWWKPVNTGLPETDVYSLAADGATLYAGTSHGVFKSADSGAGWTAVGSGLPADFPAKCLAISNGDLAASSGSQAFLSRDNGASWKAVHSGMPKGADIFCLAVGETDLFAGTELNGIFVSKDDGDGWQPVLHWKEPETEIHCLFFNGTDLLAGTGGGLDAMILPDGQMMRIAHGLGVLLSTDHGAHWTAMNPGWPPIPNVPLLKGRFPVWIERLAANGSFLFAGTEQGRVWRLALSEISPEKR